MSSPTEHYFTPREAPSRAATAPATNAGGREFHGRGFAGFSMHRRASGTLTAASAIHSYDDRDEFQQGSADDLPFSARRRYFAVARAAH